MLKCTAICLFGLCTCKTTMTYVVLYLIINIISILWIIVFVETIKYAIPTSYESILVKYATYNFLL